jgi:hypothetical protein
MHACIIMYVPTEVGLNLCNCMVHTTLRNHPAVRTRLRNISHILSAQSPSNLQQTSPTSPDIWSAKVSLSSAGHLTMLYSRRSLGEGGLGTYLPPLYTHGRKEGKVHHDDYHIFGPYMYHHEMWTRDHNMGIPPQQGAGRLRGGKGDPAAQRRAGGKTWQHSASLARARRAA